MRMWMINPKFLCDKHLLGEHGEIHKHRHCFLKRHNINGRIKPVVQIEPKSMSVRHDILAAELLRRGFKHQSAYIMPDINYLPEDLRDVKVDKDLSIRDLVSRCSECAKNLRGVKEYA